LFSNFEGDDALQQLLWVISLSQLLLKVISFASYASSFAEKLQML
jgi:hypothetical protein